MPLHEVPDLGRIVWCSLLGHIEISRRDKVGSQILDYVTTHICDSVGFIDLLLCDRSRLHSDYKSFTDTKFWHYQAQYLLPVARQAATGANSTCRSFRKIATIPATFLYGRRHSDYQTWLGSKDDQKLAESGAYGHWRDV